MTQSIPPRPRIVATDWGNRNPFPETLERVHTTGIPHRAVHLEVFDEAGRLLVWRRSDGRLEIPGGHVDWSEALHTPEPDVVAAARELLEETGADPSATAVAALSGQLEHCADFFNQSQNGRNNEWVQVFRIDVRRYPAVGRAVPNHPRAFDGGANDVLSDEGNFEPRWLGLDDLLDWLRADPTGATSALRACAARWARG